MRTHLWLIVILLLGLSLGMVGYKTLVLHFDLIPHTRQDIWEIEIQVQPKSDNKLKRLYFPLPTASDRIQLFDITRDDHEYQYSELQSPLGNQGSWVGRTNDKFKLSYAFKLISREKDYGFPAHATLPLVNSENKQWLQLEPLPDRLEEEIRELESTLFSPGQNASDIVKSIYYYISEEFLDTSQELELIEAIREHQANSRVKAELTRLLCRRRQIPNRIVVGLVLVNNSSQFRPLKPVFWNEVYLNQKWIPLNTSRDQLGRLKRNLIDLVRINSTANWPPDDKLAWRFYARPSISESFDPAEYKKTIDDQPAWLARYSLFQLTHGTQYMFRILLLLPLGALMLAIFRNLIGVRSFGIFMPILLALFFMESSLWFGMLFMTMVILLSLALRRAMATMHLLLVPRLGIILSFVLLVLLGFSLYNHEFSLLPDYQTNLFPVIITTVFIERFYIVLDEQGWRNTLIMLANTILIAVSSYLLMSWDALQLILFAHPELLLTIIACLILIGSYSGYRLAELFRFRQIQSDAPAEKP
ncbi:MAG: hypothetical protein KDK39_12655 [Leptospiraceae bacterium]|nr:hypothetical protein [Leptospiraceae bacterium]